MSEIWRWLEDKTAISTLGTKDKQWLNKQRESGDKRQNLAEDVVKMIARLWLEDPEPHDSAVCWIIEFLSQPREAKSKDEEPSDLDLKAIVIAAAETWCREKLKVSEEEIGYLWYERLARTYRTYHMDPQAILNFQKSTERSKPNQPSWETAVGLGTLLYYKASTEEERLEALAMKEEALERYLGPKGSEIPITDKLVELDAIAQSLITLHSPQRKR